MFFSIEFHNPDDFLVFGSIADVVSDNAELCSANNFILLSFV